MSTALHSHIQCVCRGHWPFLWLGSWGYVCNNFCYRLQIKTNLKYPQQYKMETRWDPSLSGAVSAS